MRTFIPILLFTFAAGNAFGAITMIIFSMLQKQQRSIMSCDHGDVTDGNNVSSPPIASTPYQAKKTTHLVSQKSQATSVNNLHDPCDQEMERIYKRMDCLRGHGNGNCTVAAPLHLYGWFWGQGFGRILHQSVDTCMFAAVLERPCLIDIDHSDKYYIWRSFVNHGEYNWDWNILKRTHPHSLKNMTDAYSRLPTNAANEWSGQSAKNLPEYEHVIPMVWHNDWDHKVKEHLQYWHGSNPDNRDKILLSPSFGFAWWQQQNYHTAIEKRAPGCKLNKLRTLLQNAMFQPTTLGKQLFLERGTPMFKDIKGKPKQWENSIPPFGAIHLRTIKSDLKKTYYDNEETVKILQDCLHSVAPEIKTWWMVADNLTNADYIESRIEVVRTDYRTYESSKLRFNSTKKINFHSGYQMKQKFGHEHIAPSMEDFMILWESSMAIMTHGGFGESGARGNGKIKIKTCGKGATFKVYGKPRQ